jgi:hypothetical protein
MANMWTTRVDTPLWADANKTRDKGLVRSGTMFVEVDRHNENVKADRISYLPKGATTYTFGDGWIEIKNCVTEGTPLPPVIPSAGHPTDAEFATFKKVWKWLTV